jgi:hypothetical protein
MDFARSSNINDCSLFLLLTVKVTKAFMSIAAPGITPQAAGLLADGHTTEFEDQYGDLFVRGMLTGGFFYGLIEITTHDQLDKTSLSIAAKGSYATFSASGEFSSAFQQALSSRETSVNCYVEGGSLGHLPNTLPQLLDSAQKFYDSVEANPVPYTALLDPYTILPLPAQPNYIDLQHQKDVLEQCAAARDIDIQALNNVNYILANPSQFANPDSVALTDLRRKLQSDLDSIAAAASQALDSPKTAAFPTLQTSEINLPARISAPVGPPVIYVTVPSWGNIAAVEGHGTVPSADDLGLVINRVEDNSVLVYSGGDLVSMTPSAGTVVPRGSTVTVVVGHRSRIP